MAITAEILLPLSLKGLSEIDPCVCPNHQTYLSFLGLTLRWSLLRPPFVNPKGEKGSGYIYFSCFPLDFLYLLGFSSFCPFMSIRQYDTLLQPRSLCNWSPGIVECRNCAPETKWPKNRDRDAGESTAGEVVTRMKISPHTSYFGSFHALVHCVHRPERTHRPP